MRKALLQLSTRKEYALKVNQDPLKIKALLTALGRNYNFV